MTKSLYILDGHYQIFRAFYAPFGELTSPSGEPTRATYVFLSTLFSLIRNRRPDFIAMALDAGDATTFRRALDENYKAHRDPAPEGLHVQAERITSIVSQLGIPTFVKQGYEADDLLATIAERVAGEDLHVYLVSRDKDLEQLITDRVSLYDVSKGEVLDAAALMEKKGYTPAQAVEIQTLTGDSTDNIPGVQGIGVKTAAKLIGEYGSAQAVFENAAKLTPKMAERVREYAEQLPLTRQLVTLLRDVPMEFSLEDCATDKLDFEALRPVFEELNFHRLTDQLGEFAGARGQEVPSTTSESRDAAPVPPTVSAQPGEYHLVDTMEAFEVLVQKLAGCERFAFDTETTGLNPVAAELVGLSFSWKSGEGYYVPVRAVMGAVLPLESVVELLQPVMEDSSIGKIGQNIKYDVLVLRQVGIEVRGIAFDTMIASFLLDPLARSHSMNALAKQYFNHDMIPISDLIGKGKNQITMDQIDTKHVSEYAAEDADFTWRLYEVLAPRIDDSGVAPLFRETEMPLVEVLAEMEHNGIALDTKLLAELSVSLASRMEGLTDDIHKEAGHPFNIASTQQLAKVLFDEQGLEVVKKTKTGRSTDADTLSTLAEKTDHPIPKLMLSYRELTKLKNTYVDTLPKMVCKRTGRVHASFDQIGVVTGRLSSREPNLQNIPVRTEAGREIRRAIVASDPEWVLLTADYSQVELRLLAHFCKDTALVAAFESGQDIHRAVAAEINGVAQDEVTPEQRSAAKAVNFGIIYGQSAFGLSRSLGIGIGEAKGFIDAYFARYPGIRAFIDQCVADTRASGFAQTILGRRRAIPELQSRNRQQVALGERLAINTVVQGSAADLIKRAMLAIHAAFKAGTHAAKMLIQVHDELVFEAPADGVESDAEFIRREMERALALDVPLVVDVSWGRNWADAK